MLHTPLRGMISFKYILITRKVLRIFFHIVRCAYRKIKDAKKLGASIKLRKKEAFEDGWSILEF